MLLVYYGLLKTDPLLESSQIGVYLKLEENFTRIEINNMTIETLLKSYKTIAVVGLSADSGRASNRVASYMQSAGYRIVPVRPDGDEILGEKVYHSLDDIPFPVEIVDVFRRSETVVPVAKEAVRIGAKVFWLQEGITNEEAETLCRDAGLEVISDRCILKEHLKVVRS
jgi:predicted CoA-binding protein